MGVDRDLPDLDATNEHGLLVNNDFGQRFPDGLLRGDKPLLVQKDDLMLHFLRLQRHFNPAVPHILPKALIPSWLALLELAGVWLVPGNNCIVSRPQSRIARPWRWP